MWCLLLINCYFLDGNEVPVVTGSRYNIAILPLSQGSRFTLFSSPVDNVGNRKTLERAMQDLVEIHFPIVVIPCPNNCSNIMEIAQCLEIVCVRMVTMEAIAVKVSNRCYSESYTLAQL